MSLPSPDPPFPIQKGKTYASLKEFKEAVKAWSIAEDFVSRVQHSDKHRVMIKCRKDARCPFYLRCNYVAHSDNAVVVKAETEHTCIGMAPPTRLPAASLSWLLREVPKVLEVSRTTSTRSIVDAVRIHWQQHIHIWQAQRVKALILHDTFSQHREQFFLLPSYLEELSNTNEGVYHFLQVDEENFSFRRVFVCPQHACGAFVMSLPIVALDGTFLKTRFRQTLLVAVGRDGNNDAFLLAWAIVEGESAESWGFFLEHLTIAIPEVDSDITTIISDRDKGLAAVDDRVPSAHRAWCCWHIAQNVRRNHGDAAEKVF